MQYKVNDKVKFSGDRCEEDDYGTVVSSQPGAMRVRWDFSKETHDEDPDDDRISLAWTTETLTDDMIRALRNEAGEQGDTDQVEICDLALDGDGAARGTCATVITDARAMDDRDGYVFVSVVP